MVACEVCGVSDQILFQCRHCGGRFCTEHQSPGGHLCADAPAITRIEEDPPSSLFGEIDAPVEQPDTGSEDQSVSDQADSPEHSSQPLSFHEWLLQPEILRIIPGLFLVAGVVVSFAFFGLGLLSVPEGSFPEISGSPADGASANPTDELNLTVVERDVVDRINALRMNRNRTTVIYDRALAEIAEAHSEDMAAQNYTSHVSPEGENVTDRYRRFGYECEAPSELILYTRPDVDVEAGDEGISVQSENELADGIVSLWLRSDPHRQAILSQPWEVVGIGIAVTDDDRIFVTLNAC